MALIRGRDTKPELLVRKALHKSGLRYRLHDKHLPGKPDIVLKSRMVVLFVHGCFWHRHGARKCKLARLPKTRLGYWLPKLERNRLRDKRQRAHLSRLGWHVLVIWECQLRDKRSLERLVARIKAVAPATNPDRAIATRSRLGG